MENKNSFHQQKILVTGATGKQGGAVAKYLLAKGINVRALTRNSNSTAAKKLQDAGAEVFTGNLEDIPSLQEALKGVYGVFSVQNFWEKGVGYDGEIRQGKNLINAAKEAGIKHFVQASVADVEAAPGVKHFECKKVVEDHLILSGLPYTIIRETFFMDNFLDPKNGKNMFPFLSGGLNPNTKFHMVSVDDIGALVTVVFSNPDKYIGKKLNVAGDVLTVKEMKEVYQSVTGRKPKALKLPKFMIKLVNKEMYRQLTWNNDPGWNFNLSETKEVLPETTDFRKFIELHKPQNL